MKLIVILSLFSFFYNPNSFAVEISFKDQQKSFHLKLDSVGVEFRSTASQFIITQNICNKIYLDDLRDKLRSNFRSIATSSNSKNTYRVKKNGISLNIIRNSGLGIFLFNIDRLIAEIKLRERAICAK